MLRKSVAICICLSSLLAFSQSATKPKYRVATVLAVAPHDSNGSGGLSALTYDVSVKVGNMIYVVLYTPPLGMQNAKYAAGADVLVLVGEKTITYNDISGSQIEVPILSRKSIVNAGIR